MAEEAGSLLGPKAIEQMAKIARENARRMMNERPHRARWQRVGGSGGGMEIISFSINSSDPLTRSADVEIRQRSFAGTVYGSTLDDTNVIVYDTDGCYLNEPNVDLTGRLGKAVLMLVDDEAAATHFADSYEVPEKYWNVLTLCCPHFTCE